MRLQDANEFIAAHRNTTHPRYRPLYHASVPQGWLNDPNGFIFREGKVHLFYQHNPYDAVWGPMHWGHWSSEDLIRWRAEPVALAPDECYDEGGCFSGTAIERDGALCLLYTGVKADGERNIQQQCLAASPDTIHFEKAECNPVIGASLLPGGSNLRDFRDPKVFRTSGGYRAVVASKGPRGGRLLLFGSEDLLRWEYLGVFMDGIGDMAECPDFFELAGKAVAVYCEMGADAQKYGTSQPVLYRVGELSKDGDRIVNPGEQRLIDQGLEFYAPQTASAPDGRQIMIGWMNAWGNELPTTRLGHGWAGQMTFPREVSLNADGRLVQRPVREIAALRCEAETIAPRLLKDETLQLKQGPSVDIRLRLGAERAEKIVVSLMQTGVEHIEVCYDVREETLRLDRSSGGLLMGPGGTPAPRNRASARIPLKDGVLSLDILVDVNCLEVYAQDGEAAMSALFFPEGTAYKARLRVQGQVALLQYDGWRLA